MSTRSVTLYEFCGDEVALESISFRISSGFPAGEVTLCLLSGRLGVQQMGLESGAEESSSSFSCLFLLNFIFSSLS
jgi:hypothetical protein